MVAYLTPKVFGHHEVAVTFERPDGGVMQRESIPIYVDVYERSGDLVIEGDSSGGGGCSATRWSALLAMSTAGSLFVIWRRRRNAA